MAGVYLQTHLLATILIHLPAHLVHLPTHLIDLSAHLLRNSGGVVTGKRQQKVREGASQVAELIAQCCMTRVTRPTSSVQDC